jgi:hypothetical protein
MGHLYGACTITCLRYLLCPCSFHFLGHSMGHSSIFLYTLPQPYTLGAWHGPSFSFTTVSSVLSNPSFFSAPAAFNSTKCITCLLTHTVQDSGYFYSSYDTEPLFASLVSFDLRSLFSLSEPSVAKYWLYLLYYILVTREYTIIINYHTGDLSLFLSFIAVAHPGCQSP